MPELPEVETVKNELLPHIVGRTITGITLFWERMVRQPSVSEFCSRLTGQRITGIARRGKYLIIGLSSGDSLIVHMKMSGSLLVARLLSEPPKYTRAVINLDKGTNIYFRDPRKFGAMWLVTEPDSIVGKLGPEPLEDDFTPRLLTRRLAGRSAPIKALLCDQSFIAGVGNMYADEALFAAKIHPLRSGASLSQEEIERLHSAIRQVLWSGIKNKGASIVNYYRPDGSLGTAHSQFKVAHCGGKTCPDCGAPIQRIVVRNRGTYFCPVCQPEK
ncbi:MAG: bifunctional DNA-formamidopyrimidine glycosylase/DNA-(apurinic or apyrimidinic site) lyase [Dehalococcoidales bacterium]|nr:bifunctional DNA-formamidopyrimidine glycosylase/DNA-(apurinic or apyrimidinic site) lyase [Dehalococcoidales bacterium]